MYGQGQVIIRCGGTMLTGQVITYQFGYETNESRAIRPNHISIASHFAFGKAPAG
jgi:hypothetical protein